MASSNEELEALPVTGVRSSEAMGKLLLFPRTGIVGVPFEHVPEGWNVVVVAGDAAGVYPPGGWHILVGRREIERAVEVPLVDLPLLRAQHPKSGEWTWEGETTSLFLRPGPGTMLLCAEGRYSWGSVVGVRVWDAQTNEQVFSSRQVIEKDDTCSIQWVWPKETYEVHREYVANIGPVKNP